MAATPWLAARTIVGLGDVVAADPGATSTGIGDSAVTGPTRASVAGKTYLALITGLEGASGAAAPQIKYFLLN